ncbi:MAG: hypothetical protein ING75_09170 [Rhodocyclaceae bacterium]|nr:hypothetical protein [Rhodocyclaceae bacterium]MCA3086772.1 hypothetical protein [Rhodocyclaceae bacterium]
MKSSHFIASILAPSHIPVANEPLLEKLTDDAVLRVLARDRKKTSLEIARSLRATQDAVERRLRALIQAQVVCRCGRNSYAINPGGLAAMLRVAARFRKQFMAGIRDDAKALLKQ